MPLPFSSEPPQSRGALECAKCSEKVVEGRKRGKERAGERKPGGRWERGGRAQEKGQCSRSARASGWWRRQCTCRVLLIVSDYVRSAPSSASSTVLFTVHALVPPCSLLSAEDTPSAGAPEGLSSTPPSAPRPGSPTGPSAPTAGPGAVLRLTPHQDEDSPTCEPSWKGHSDEASGQAHPRTSPREPHSALPAPLVQTREPGLRGTD